MKFWQLQSFMLRHNLVLERSRRDGGKYSLYDNTKHTEYCGLKNFTEVMEAYKEARP